MTHDARPPGQGVDRGGGSAAGGDLGCEDAMKSVFDYLDGELPPDYSEKVRRHIEMCKRCYPYFNFEQAFLDYLHDRGVKPARSDRLEERLRTLLGEVDTEEAEGCD